MPVSGTGATTGGESMSAEAVVRLLHQVGFRGEDLVTAAGIASRESSWDPGALNPNKATEDLSYGLFQINMLGNLGPTRRQRFGLNANADLYDPLRNAQAAFQMYQANGFYDWGPYKGMEPTYNVSEDALAEARSAAESLGLFDGEAPSIAGDRQTGEPTPPWLWEQREDDMAALPQQEDPRMDALGAMPQSMHGSLGTAGGSLGSAQAMGSLGLPGAAAAPRSIVQFPDRPDQPAPSVADNPGLSPGGGSQGLSPDGGAGLTGPTGGAVDRFVDLALAQVGKPYRLGASATGSNPSAFDCSELVKWAAEQVGVKVPDGSWIQYEFFKEKGWLIPVEQAINTKGAILFNFGFEPGGGRKPTLSQGRHVAISLGDGQTIEARGRAYGVGSWPADGRFNYAAVIPDLGMAGTTPMPSEPERSQSQGRPLWQR